MTKIIRIITRLNIGGPAIHAVLLTEELNKNGSYRDILVCGSVSKSEGDMAYMAKRKGVEPVVIPELTREIGFYNDIRAFFRIFSIIRKERPDIVHTHTAKAGALGRLAAILAGVPVRVHTFHGHIFDGYFSPGKARIFLLIEKALALFTDRVITVSARVEHEIIDKLKVAHRAKSAVVPLGLELDRFFDCETGRGAFRKRAGLSDETLLVGIVGRLVPIKNHEMFLDSAKAVLDKKPGLKIKFLVIGDGERRSHLEEYAKRLGIEKDVIFTGWIEDLADLYADLDIVALTSLNEGTPVSIIEALASARAVVATAVGGVADIISDNENGLLSVSGDVRMFAEKIAALAGDRDMRFRLGSCGRSFVRERYSKERLARDIKGLYEDCIKAKGVKVT